MPVNKIDLVAETRKEVKTPIAKSRSNYMKKLGVIPSNPHKQRQKSRDSNYGSDYSAGQNAFTLSDQKNISMEEFQNVQNELMHMIEHSGGVKDMLEFKKKFSTIKGYCKLFYLS